jgi:hypothetical protein
MLLGFAPRATETTLRRRLPMWAHPTASSTVPLPAQIYTGCAGEDEGAAQQPGVDRGQDAGSIGCRCSKATGGSSPASASASGSVSASQAVAVAAKAGVTSRSLMSQNPAARSSRWWSLRMATALGPAARAGGEPLVPQSPPITRYSLAGEQAGVLRYSSWNRARARPFVSARHRPTGGLDAGTVDVGLAAAGALQRAVSVGANMQMPGVVFTGDRSADGAFPAVGGLAALGAQQGCRCLHRSFPSLIVRSWTLGGAARRRPRPSAQLSLDAGR